MYQFSFLWFFVGLAVIGLGVAFMRFYKEVADNMGSGAASYDRYKIAALCVSGVGILMMFNLHNLIIAFIANLIFGGTLNN
ncbi:hypothetical protein FWD20_02990 [Candidatus Saccharibacteria bacterium]|nr:hypothetical protein [Candidatus Saccharibacteria bacterium]